MLPCNNSVPSARGLAGPTPPWPQVHPRHALAGETQLLWGLHARTLALVKPVTSHCTSDTTHTSCLRLSHSKRAARH